jgi:hypothetical protein
VQRACGSQLCAAHVADPRQAIAFADALFNPTVSSEVQFFLEKNSQQSTRGVV